MTKRRLEIGAGGRPTKGYEHLDCREGKHIEIVADARHIPVEDCIYDEIYSHWVFEHFAWREINNVLKEWKRVLKFGGLITIITNNQEAHNKCLLEGNITWQEWVRLTYGIREESEIKQGMSFEPDVYECHKIGFTGPLLNKLLRDAGFKNINIRSVWACREADGKIRCPGLVATAIKPIENNNI